MKIYIFAIFFIFFIVVIILLGSSTKDTKEEDGKIRYIAIGDSYTIGQGVSPKESWPTLLTDHLRKSGIDIELISNPAVSGFTTQDAIDYELPEIDSESPNFVTVLIGANDSFQGIDPQVFRAKLIILLDKIQDKLPDKKKVILITIPDYSVVPAMTETGDIDETKKLIVEYNNIIKAEGVKRDVPVVDIFPLTEKLKNKTEYFVSDGLHPSKEQYKLWEKLVYPVAYSMLKSDNK